MKKLLFLLLGWGVLGASPVWINRGDPVPLGLLRIKLNSPTQSMAPTMKGNEWCWFEQYGGQEIKVNDFVWFVRSDGAQVLHRVTALNKRAIYPAGDANSRSDGWVTNNKVRFILRYVERPEVSYLAQVK